MKKILKQTTVSLITAAILGSIIPMKSHAEEITKPISENNTNQVNTQTSIPAPPILQGRAVNTNYPQMPKPNVEAFSNEDGTGTGYLDVSWEPVEGITKYQIILFNGSIHSYWDVPADQTTWTTKDKGMFPTNEQIEAGQVNFRRDGKGTDFVVDPSTLYKKAFEINGGLNYSNSSEYYVRVTAVHEDGASPISYATKTSILVETPLNFGANGYKIDNENGFVDLEWDQVLGAKGYKVSIWNGNEYQTFDVGNVTNWSTKNKGIWPTNIDIQNNQYQLNTDRKGTELPIDPLSTYKITGNTFSDTFLFKVSAYNFDNYSFITESSDVSFSSILASENETYENQEFNQIETLFAAIESMPEEIASKENEDTVNWLSKNTGINFVLEEANIKVLNENTITPAFSISGCTGAIGWALISAGIPATKILKLKKAIDALGGATKFAKAFYSSYKLYRSYGNSKTTAVSRAVKSISKNLKTDLQFALMDFFNINNIIANCT